MNVFWTLSLLLTIQLEAILGVHKCSNEVLKQIKELWAKEGKPTDLIKQAVAAGKQNVIQTTKDYYPDGTSCSYTEFAKDGTSVTLTTVVHGKKEAEHENVVEKDGAVIEKDTGITRYHVFSKDGVAAWYKCGGKNAVDGGAEGAIKVPNGIKYSKADVEEAAKRLKAVGVKLEKDFSSIC